MPALHYPHDIPSLNQIDPTSFPTAKFSNDAIQKGQAISQEDVTTAQKLATDLRDMRKQDGTAAQWFLTDEMLHIADLRPKAIEQAHVAAVFPNPIDQRITNLETIQLETQRMITMMQTQMQEQFSVMNKQFSVMQTQIQEQFSVMQTEFGIMQIQMQERFNGMAVMLAAQAEASRTRQG